MRYVVEFVGGPLDGRSKPRTSKAPCHMWVRSSSDSAQAVLTISEKPESGAFYRREHQRRVGKSETYMQTFLYAGHTHVFCKGCDGVHRREGKTCTNCGTSF